MHCRSSLKNRIHKFLGLTNPLLFVRIWIILSTGKKQMRKNRFPQYCDF